MIFMHYSFVPSGVCCKKVDMEINDNIVTDVVFTGGCNGNLKGIAALVEGQKVEDIISRLRGIHCHIKSTSCPDQLAKGLEAYLKANK